MIQQQELLKEMKKDLKFLQLNIIVHLAALDHKLKIKEDEVGLTQKEIWEKKYK